MLTEICAEIRNYFTWIDDRHIGDFAIIDGQITPSIDFKTDYFRIVGSKRNDGVHMVGDALMDEDTFHGAVWIMSVPADFLALANEIEEWQKVNGGVNSQAMSPYQSESFGGYSYSKASGGSAAGSGQTGPTWQSMYAKRLNIYRKMRAD